MAEGGGESKSLEQTPTWAVAVVCTVFVVASLLLERAIHRLGKRFKKAGQNELFHTLEQIKNELMLLGFISLLLTAFQPKVASICMPERLGHRMLPCPYEAPVEAPTATPVGRRRLFATEATSTSPCKAGYVPVISVEGLHQLHIFIFVLAVIHVLYSCFTVLVGLLQVRSWKKWETEAHEDGAKVADDLAQKKKHHDPTKAHHPTKAHEHGTNFTKGRIKYQFLHSSSTGLNLDAYVYCFFRQFGKPIYKEDYLALRFGFIGAHHLNPNYDFHSYIRRTMEGDFKRVVGISAYLWAFVCVFLLLDMNGWYTYFWIAFIPTILVLIVGGKLQHIIIDLAIEVRGGLKKIDFDDLDDGLKKADHPGGAVEVQPMRPRDDLFWFSKPRLLIKLIHFILFQNAFELAFFFWAMFEYGFNSCLVGKKWMIIVRLGMGVFVQILCSASTLPLYALVSQMGSTVKGTIFKEETISDIHKWHEKATQKSKSHPRQRPVSHRLAGIIGLNKEKDAEGNVRDFELLDHHNHGNGHGQPHAPPHGHHPQHPHQQPHAHPADSHNVEIRQEPLVITQASEPSNPREHDNGSQVPPKATSTKPSAFSSITKLALEKERERNKEPRNDVP
ncbi:hypothetical protein M758_3G010600 [Ceratodon purpureus]|uniref:MLO-like protein n=1 Tax=Ceratodon purpureus TaxID=3225 RepID=A0A8T0IH77_CERPU|nr:hypothetical protein KC19_3G010800 [Ceratodon purpureus]KAG0621322.1 hypothetical protein M758_3G010600 [Ceratodon purpureus]